MDIRAIATRGLWTRGGVALTAPTVISAVRNGASGSAVVQGTAGDTIYCYATNLGNKNRVLLGSVLATGGDDAIALDFSSFTYSFYIMTLTIAAVNLEFVSENSGLFSDTTDYPFSEFIDANSLTITNYVRGMDTAEFDVAGLPADFTVASILLTDYDGYFGAQPIVNGHNIITGLHPAPLWRLEGLILQQTSSGTIWLADKEVGDFLSALPVIPTIDSINVLIYQAIKNDSIFQALTGADVNDPRVYLDHPPQMVSMDLNHPGYATYSLEGGGGIEPTRAYLVEMPDRHYKIDVWGRTKGDVDKIFKRIQDIFIYRYFDDTTEEQVRAIRPLSPGTPQFVSEVRLYHVSGMFAVEGIMRKNF